MFGIHKNPINFNCDHKKPDIPIFILGEKIICQNFFFVINQMDKDGSKVIDV